MELTEQELIDIRVKRKLEENERIRKTPTREGFLKTDCILLESNRFEMIFPEYRAPVTVEQSEALFTDAFDSFREKNKIIKKGTKYLYYPCVGLNHSYEHGWRLADPKEYNLSYEHGKSNYWAENHLENIKDV